MVRFRLLCGVFLLPNPAPNLDNRKTVCMGYTAMTPQGRAGKRRRKGAGKPCRENGTLNIKWSKWPPDWGNNTKRHSPETSSTLQLIPCGHFDHMEWTDVAQVNVFKLNTLTPSVLRLPRLDILPSHGHSVLGYENRNSPLFWGKVVSGQTVQIPPICNA